MACVQRALCGLFLLLSSYQVISQPIVVQGPFKVDGNDNVFIKQENDVNYPLALYFESNGNSSKVESYETDGDYPHVETVFCTKLKSQKNVIVLISWRQKHTAESIGGNSYQVYGYKYKANDLIINPLIKNDPNLNGLDGEFDGKMLSFKYKGADNIKQYLKLRYK